MKEKSTPVYVLLIILFTLTFCSESVVDPEVPDSAATKRRSKPTANAGVDSALDLPTHSTLLDGSLSEQGDYPLTEFQWNKISGPDSYSIDQASNKKTLVSNLVEGIYTFELLVIDDHNFRDKDEVVITVKSNSISSLPTHTITGFSPSSGYIGSTVVITGSSFGNSPSVTFNGVPAIVLLSSSTSITATVPATASTGVIAVTIESKTAVSASSFNVLTVLPEEFYFQGNMDDVSILKQNPESKFIGWTDLLAHPYVGGLYLNNSGGMAYAFQEIRKDPVNANKNVLYAQVIDDDPAVGGTSRAQTTLGLQDGNNLSVYHTSHRMYLNPDINHLTNYSAAVTWFTIFEIWNQRVSAWSGDPAGSARWSFAIQKATGTSQPLFWRITSEYMQPSNLAFVDIWDYTNKSVAIPFGQWFTLDVYMKRGEGSNGKMTIKITPDGGPTTVLFDITNTTIYPGHPEIQLSAWQPFKLYLNDVYLDWMRTNNKTISAYYNDFKWYKN